MNIYINDRRPRTAADNNNIYCNGDDGDAQQSSITSITSVTSITSSVAVGVELSRTIDFENLYMYIFYDISRFESKVVFSKIGPLVPHPTPNCQTKYHIIPVESHVRPRPWRGPHRPPSAQP